jgi:hypothetical protein
MIAEKLHAMLISKLILQTTRAKTSCSSQNRLKAALIGSRVHRLFDVISPPCVYDVAI